MLRMDKTLDFSKVGDAIDPPGLVQIQTASYDRFLQADVSPQRRKNEGLEGLLREIFPIISYDSKANLEYVGYELGEPRYTPEECRQLRLTYGRPFRMRCRLKHKDIKGVLEESIYMGDMPIMIGGGEFIVNGAERVIVSQLHRSPGVDFTVEFAESDRPLHGARIIPERGSWIEMGVTKKEVLAIRIDQSSKFPITTFLRAMNEDYGTTEAILRLFYETEKISPADAREHMYAVTPIIDPTSGEILVEAGHQIGDASTTIQMSGPGGLGGISVVPEKLRSILKAKDCKDLSKSKGEAKSLRAYYAKNILTEFKYIPYEPVEDFTQEDIKKQLEAVESLICIEHPDSSPRSWKNKRGFESVLPRLNQWDYKSWGRNPEDAKEKAEDTLKKTKGLAGFLKKCKVAIREKGEWLVYADDVLKGEGDALKKPGIYLLRNVDRKKSKTNGIGEGYVGISGTGKTKKDMLFTRLHEHLTGTAEVDTSFLNTLILDFQYLCEQNKQSKQSGKGTRNTIEVINKPSDDLLLNTLIEDQAESHEKALLMIYARLRPGNPPQLERAKTLFREKFYDENRYRLGKVGRFRLSRKFQKDGSSARSVPVDAVMTLESADMVNIIGYILYLRSGEGVIDDIDHLGNRRLRTIDELAGDEIRKGFLKLRRTVQERVSLKEPEELNKIAELVNSKSVSASIDYFFGRSELSQVVDQTNPLSQLTHERRLSALGPGGLNRKRAGFEVRDVHLSHYGRICPIETPEGNNIGLISSLSLFAAVDEYGFLITPYQQVRNRRLTDDIKWLRADEESEAVLAPPDVLKDDETSGSSRPTAASGRSGRKIPDRAVLVRAKSNVTLVPGEDVEYLDVSPKQTVGISAALIPFLEHDDANRALMGSNMQRQAVPLIKTEAPIIATGLEKIVAADSGMVVRARKAGTVTYADAQRIVIDNVDEYELRKFARLNERTCLNQKPIIKIGQRVRKNEIIADGPACCNGELALGKNILVAFVPFDGYNFEDAILISQKLVKEDVFTSIHIEEYDVEVRETKLGKEEFTRDIPNVSERALRDLDTNGIVSLGTRVKPGDILVGKVSPKSKSELTPEEKLLHAIFGRAGEDVKNDSLELPAGEEGVVIATKRFSRRVQMSDERKKAMNKEMKAYSAQMDEKAIAVFRQMCDEINNVLGSPMVDPSTRQKVGASDIAAVILEQIENFKIKWIKGKAADRERAKAVHKRYWPTLEKIESEKQRKLAHMKRGDELPSGVLEMAKVYVVTKRKLSVGDKMAGRHGNKGVIARIMPEEDMPFLSDGTPVEICLNPLGVPSRMNVGQILETHLGWAAAVLGFQAVTPVFDGATETEITQAIEQANEHVRTRQNDIEAIQSAGATGELLAEMPTDGKTIVYDGRTGEPFEQKVTVGYMYMNKLHHLVDDKIHARSTGPYSLITQQPLGGKARTGGQRFGEMEVWALESYGASYMLQEMLTVKSDDVEGRTKIYESMVKGVNTLEAGTPVSFDVLCNELRGLGMNIQLEKKSLI